MKCKTLISLVFSAVILTSVLCACSGEKAETTTDAQTTQAQTTSQADTTEEGETVIAEIPTESGGNIAESALVVTDFTVYERKEDGTVVKETPMKDVKLSKETVSFNGKEVLALTGDYKTDSRADYVSFAFTCRLNSQAGIALGKVFNKTDGDKALEVKCQDSDGTEIPLKINVIF